ncbi:MAG TPA: toll/interleukin-1 receptor domain-containing protein [Aggregatilineales bacterium]|nr:toll/interleukin-1 receptor domain-containing protein [Aggregatilineales bacterium]
MGNQRIFISYAHEDLDFVENLESQLTNDGFDVWFDRDGIPSSAPWAATIAEAIKECTDLIAVHSEASLGRSYQAKGEWVHARDLGKRIHPVIIGTGINNHSLFSHLQAVDFSRTGGFAEAYKRVVSGLRSSIKQPRINKKTYQIEYGTRPILYPDVCNSMRTNVGELMDSAVSIDYLSITGFYFIIKNSSILIDRLSAGTKVRIVLAQRNELNLNTVASWAIFPEDAKQRTLEEERGFANQLRHLLKQSNNNSSEVRLLDYVPPLSILATNMHLENGQVFVSFYPIGPSVDEQKVFRPAILINRQVFSELFNHFVQQFENAWAMSKVTNAYQNI